MLLSAIADEAKDTKLRDEALRNAVNAPSGNQAVEALRALAKAMQAALAKGERVSFGENELRRHKPVVAADCLLNLNAGHFEALHGSKDMAIEYFKAGFRPGRQVDLGYALSMLCSIWARSLGLDPMELQKRAPPPAKKVAPEQGDF